MNLGPRPVAHDEVELVVFIETDSNEMHVVVPLALLGKLEFFLRAFGVNVN